MKVSTSSGSISGPGRGLERAGAASRTLDQAKGQTIDGSATEVPGLQGLPDLAAFGDRTPPRGSFVNILA